jgi:PEP-CTERM motif
MNFRAVVIALTLSSAAAAGAHAGEILFTITGAGADPNSTFVLPENPSPDVVRPGLYFGFFSVPASIEGSPGSLFGLDLFNTSNGGGLSDQTFYDLMGAQLYAGPEGSPTFVPGVYANMFNQITGNTDTVTLTVVPEPSIWAMMLLGFAGLGFVGHRRTKNGTALATSTS